MPTPTEAAQFHIFSIKRIKYMPKKKSESRMETFLKSFCSAKESFRSSESIGLRIIIMNVDMTARIEQKRKDLCMRMSFMNSIESAKNKLETKKQSPEEEADRFLHNC